jgi:hypothetical protein
MFRFKAGNVIQFTQGKAIDQFAEIVKVEPDFRVTYNLYGWNPPNQNAHVVGSKGQYWRYYDDSDWVSARLVAEVEGTMEWMPEMKRHYWLRTIE